MSAEHDLETERSFSSLSIEAALARANLLVLASTLQDTLMRIACALLFVGAKSFIDERVSSAALVVLGAIWMISKSRLGDTASRIERDFVAPALRSEGGNEASKWPHLSIVLQSYDSSTRSRVRWTKLLRFEPLLLTSCLALLILSGGWLADPASSVTSAIDSQSTQGTPPPSSQP